MSEHSDPVSRRQRIWHRMVGAAVLAALVVILVPFIIDLQDDEGPVITRSNIPERPPGFRVEEIALTPPEAIRREPQVSTSAAEPSSPRPDPDLDPAATEVPAAETGPAEASPPRGPASAGAVEVAPQAFAVQIGSFSSEENATALRNRLRERGYSAFLDRHSVEGRPVVRVLVGPDARREHSERLRDRLDREMNIKGVVVGYQ